MTSSGPGTIHSLFKTGISLLVVPLILAAFSGCGEPEQVNETSILISHTDPQNSAISPDMIQFEDEVESGPIPTFNLLSLNFKTLENQDVELGSLFRREKKLILIIMTGFTNEIGKYCITQTSRLISNYSKFSDRETEIVIIYPVSSELDNSRLQELQMATAAQLQVPFLTFQIPFPMLLDVNLDAVKKLGIERNLSRPATYIFDPAGHLRFSYVGKHAGDRPSVQALLDQIDKIK